VQATTTEARTVQATTTEAGAKNRSRSSGYREPREPPSRSGESPGFVWVLVCQTDKESI
jgi:hypothetical protein